MNQPRLIVEPVFVKVPWDLRFIAKRFGGHYRREREATEFKGDIDLTELYAAIDEYYRENPRVRAPKQPRIQPGPDVAEFYIDYNAQGREEAQNFIKSIGGRYHGERADRGEKGYWLVPNEHLERVKGMIELPAISWGRS